jgi:hypothetical protein
VTALVVGLAIAVGLLGVLVAGLLRGHAEVLRALHGLGVDLDPSRPGMRVAGSGSARQAVTTAVPPPGVRPTPARPDDTDLIDLTGTTPGGDALSLAVTGVSHDTLIAFLTTGCSTCRGFWEAFRSQLTDVPGSARLLVVTRGPEAESPGTVAGFATAVPVVMSSEAWEHYDVPYAPYFVYVSGRAGRVVGEGVAATWPEVRQLVANAVADGTTAPPAGGAVPSAGGAVPSAGGPGGRARSRGDRDRDESVDRQLAAAGIFPGDPRLYRDYRHDQPGASPATQGGREFAVDDALQGPPEPSGA